jgi:acetate kinase
MAVLNGCDAVIFAGGIGENATPVRQMVCEGLDGLGIEIDAGRNAQTIGIEGRISKDSSRVPVWVIPTNEELLIARDTVRCIEGLPLP